MADLTNFHNTNYSGGVPIALGDRYYGQDLGRDIDYLRSLPGQELRNMFNSFPAFISGGLVTQGAGVTLNITAAVALCKFAVTVPNSYASFPPTTQSKDIVVLVSSTQQTNLAVTPAGTTYVKLRYKEANGASRTHAWAGGSQVYDVTDSFEFVVNGTPNTDYDVLLATFTESGGILTITQRDWTNTRVLNYNLPFVQRNVIINGGFNVAQRNTSFTDASSANFYTLDRWEYTRVGTGRATIAQVASTVSSTRYAYRVTVTTNDAAVATTDYYQSHQKVEGYDFIPLKNSTALVSFYVTAAKAGIYCLAAVNSAGDRAYIKEYTIATAATRQLIKLEIPFGTETTGTWLSTNGIGVNLIWTIAGGSDFQDTANQWNANGKFCTANQVNGFDSTNTFEIDDVQLIQGATADWHPIQHRSFSEELIKCQRFYQKSYSYADPPGTVSISGEIRFVAQAINVPYGGYVNYIVQIRNKANVIFYNSISGAVNSIRDYSTSGDVAFVAYTECGQPFQSEKGCNIYSLSNLFTANHFYGFQWIVDAEL